MFDNRSRHCFNFEMRKRVARFANFPDKTSFSPSCFAPELHAAKLALTGSFSRQSLSPGSFKGDLLRMGQNARVFLGGPGGRHGQ